MPSNTFPQPKPPVCFSTIVRWSAFVCAVLIQSVPMNGFGASVTLEPVADTSLFEETPNNNLGASDLASGTTAKGKRSRALIRFDLSDQVPASATITSVQLNLRVVKAPPSAVASTFGLHRVLKDWGEGVKGELIGQPATADEATWKARFFPSTLWSVDGAAAPDDFVTTASATRQIAGVASYSFVSTASLVSDVQAWLADPQSNFGWIVVSQSERTARTARRFGSIEEPAVAASLVIQFSDQPTATAPSITAGPQAQSVQAGGSVTFSVTATGTAPLSYQWKLNNEPITGATSPSLTLNNLQAANAGPYVVTVSNSAGSATSTPVTLTVTPPPTTGKRWTIMVYGHADHNLSASLVTDMQEMEAAGSGPDFNIVVQTDFDATSQETVANGLPAALANGITRFLVQKDGNPNVITSPPVEQAPESLNMDDPAVLTQFINWAAQKYPADRYGLVLWNHGGQWAGFGGDSQDGTLTQKGNLSTAQIRQAVGSAMLTSGIQKWDFISFDTCLMGGAEVLSDFVPLTDVFIACAEIDYGDGWDYNAALSFLKANPEVSPMDFGRAEVTAWEAHHMQPGKESDLELASHGLYDLTKYAAFEQQFNVFGSLLNQAGALRTSVLPRLRQETTQYSLNGVKDIGQPTDYIDLGELADRLVANASTDAALKAASTSLIASIDTLVAAKVRGAKKQLTHGLSVYYPVPGSKDDAGYLGLSISSKPGSTWSQLLAGVAGDRAGDQTAPDLAPAEEAPANPAPASLSPSSFSASAGQPANVKVQVLSGTDAYGMYASIVDNQFTGQANEYVYLGEILSSPISGVGIYNVTWNASLPMLSSSAGANSVVLGGFFEDIGSDILVSFADYVPPGSTEKQFVVLLTQIKAGVAKVISVLDGDEEDEGLAPQGIDLQAGGTLTPAYYLERRAGEDPSKWVSDETAGKSAIVVPANGLAGLNVTFAQVPNGVYTMEVQVVDLFKNESEVLTYSIAVGPSTSNPSLSVQAGAAGKVVVSWPTSATGFVLESNGAAVSTGWSAVPPGDVATDGANRKFTDTVAGTAKFYRLKKN